MTKKLIKYQPTQVAYHNQLNSLVLPKFYEQCLNVYETMLVFWKQQLKDEGATNPFVISTAYIADKLGVDKAHLSNLRANIDTVMTALGEPMQMYRDDGSYQSFYMLKRSARDDKSDSWAMWLNEDDFQIFRELNNRFTRYDLSTYAAINGKYAKRLFPLLMQWKTCGKLIMTPKKLANLLQAPNRRLMVAVVTPAVKELSKIIPSLKVKPTYKMVAGHKRLMTIEFTFAIVKSDLSTPKPAKDGQKLINVIPFPAIPQEQPKDSHKDEMVISYQALSQSEKQAINDQLPF